MDDEKSVNCEGGRGRENEEGGGMNGRLVTHKLPTLPYVQTYVPQVQYLHAFTRTYTMHTYTRAQ